MKGSLRPLTEIVALLDRSVQLHQDKLSTITGSQRQMLADMSKVFDGQRKKANPESEEKTNNLTKTEE